MVWYVVKSKYGIAEEGQDGSSVRTLKSLSDGHLVRLEVLPKSATF